jgi:hypothetical protein
MHEIDLAKDLNGFEHQKLNFHGFAMVASFIGEWVVLLVAPCLHPSSMFHSLVHASILHP